MIEQTKSRMPRSHSLFAEVRLAAQAVLRGPSHIVMRNLGGERFFGWSNLALEVRSAGSDQVESRSVYANLFDTSQKWAILRSVYLDGNSVRKAIQSNHLTRFDLVLPARFVIVPTRRLRTWLSEFGGIEAVIPRAFTNDQEVDIRRLRIEREYVSQVFEKIWQIEDTEHVILNDRWNRVWEHMTTTLVNGAIAKRVCERFRVANPEAQYDLRAYQPKRYTSR